MKSRQTISTAALELETGFSGDLLRKWRMRYGFPHPANSVERAYSKDQLSQLRLIRRLLDEGYRPSQIVGKTRVELELLAGKSLCSEAQFLAQPFVREIIDCLKCYDLNGLRQKLDDARQGISLGEYTRNVVAPLTTALGIAWANKEIRVHHEHLCTGILVNMLSAELNTLHPKPGTPRIVFCTPVNEPHMLGLLMAQCVLAELGAECISLGPQIPINELAQTAQACEADIVAVSFSFAYPKRQVRPWLSKLKSLLPEKTVIWAGGAGAAVIRRKMPGIWMFSNLIFASTQLQVHAAARIK
jgi:MerR family transcriptional regulator, light-induced transcriptional regulator